MRSTLAFDEYVYGTTSQYTSSFFNVVLGEYERCSLSAVAEPTTVDPTTVEIQIETSSDGRNWIAKSVNPEISGSLDPTTATVFTWLDMGDTPSLSLVRLRVALGGMAPSAQVKVYVRERDGTGISPLAVPGIVAWFRADRGITLNGANVSAWADQSRTGDSNKTATQSTGMNQPTFTSNDPFYNNRSTVSFDGIDDWLATGAWSAAPPTANATIFVVGNNSSSPMQEVFLDSISAQRYLLDNNVAPDSIRWYLSNTVPTAGLSLQNPTVIACAFSAGTADPEIYVNARTPILPAVSPGSSTPTGLTLGSDQAHTAGFLNGKLAEVVIYNRRLATHEREALLTYFGSRYGIEISP